MMRALLAELPLLAAVLGTLAAEFMLIGWLS